MRKNLKTKRIVFIGISLLISLAALLFIIINFRDNIVFFYSPSELKTLKISNQKIIRVGGLVKKNSIRYLADSKIEFTITDLQEELVIEYRGIKPDLFRDGQGTVAKGIWNQEKNIFVAGELLTKHDEKYMPPEVGRALKNAALKK